MFRKEGTARAAGGAEGEREPDAPLTAEQLCALDAGDARTELVGGELVREPPAGFGHGAVAATLAHYLWAHVHEHGLGRVCGAETGFVLARDPDTVRAPDAAFVSAHRLTATPQREGFFTGPPDLAVEILSASNSRAEIRAKVEDYLGAGTRLVWVVDPWKRRVTAHRPGAEVEVLEGGDTLDGEGVLPGFALPVTALFEG